MPQQKAARDLIVDKLRDLGLTVRESGGQISAQCPAHEDRSPSLSIGHRRDRNGVVIKCHAGCETDAVVDALDLTPAALFDDPKLRHAYAARKSYTYPGGRINHRIPKPHGGKTFRQQNGGSRDKTLYLGDQLGDSDATVYLCEGEKAADAMRAAYGVIAVATGGATRPVDYSVLDGRDVVLIEDNDAEGRKWSAKAVEALAPIAKSVKVVRAAFDRDKADAADHIAAGFSLDEFVDVDQADEIPARRARITWATDIEPEPVTWAWEDNGEGRIAAGTLSVGAGREGTGKSSFGIWTAAQISKGTLPGSFSGTPRKVFYVAVEDSWKYTLIPRLMAAGADLSMVGRFDVISDDDGELTLSLPHDNELLENEIREHGVALVVIDPLMSVIGERIDTHREREVRSALDPLAGIADRTGSIIFGVAHFNKSSSTDAASLITGSGAFKNVPRSVFGFARDNNIIGDGDRVMTQVKNSLGRDDLPSLSYQIESTQVRTRKGIATTGKFMFLGESERTVADVLRDSGSSLDEYEIADRGDAAEWLDKYLLDNGGIVEAKTVIAAAEAAGYNAKTIKNVRSKVARHKREGFGKGSKIFWIHRSTPIDTDTGPVGPEDQKPGPTGPTAGPTSDSAQLDAPPGAPTANTPGQTDRVLQSLVKARSKPPICPDCKRAPARNDTGRCDFCAAKTTADGES